MPGDGSPSLSAEGTPILTASVVSDQNKNNIAHCAISILKEKIEMSGDGSLSLSAEGTPGSSVIKKIINKQIVPYMLLPALCFEHKAQRR